MSVMMTTMMTMTMVATVVLLIAPTMPRSCFLMKPMTMLASERPDDRNERAIADGCYILEPKKGCRLALGAVRSSNRDPYYTPSQKPLLPGPLAFTQGALPLESPGGLVTAGPHLELG